MGRTERDILRHNKIVDIYSSRLHHHFIISVSSHVEHVITGRGQRPVTLISPFSTALFHRALSRSRIRIHSRIHVHVHWGASVFISFFLLIIAAIKLLISTAFININYN
jgi:hypothetical protein